MNCAIVLAAGLSRRMGAHKVLLPLGETTVIGHIVDQLLMSIVDEVYVVVGHRRDRVVEELSGREVQLVTNADYRAGMLSSIRCGLRALPPECEAVMVVLGDQPSLRTELADEMIRQFATAGKGIVVPVHRGRRGHPLLLAARYRAEILSRYEDTGLRGLLRAHPDDVFEFDVPTSEVLADMDFPEDYRRQLARRRRD